MSLRYADKGKVCLFVVFCLIKASNVLFVAYMVKIMLNTATSGSKDVDFLIRLALTTAVGQLFFTLSNFIYEHIKMEIIRSVNVCLKSANLFYLVDQGKSNIKNGLSLMTNDLKQIETNRIEAQLDMIYQAILFVGSISFAFINSWQMTIIFLVASVAPALVQLGTSKIISYKAAIWAEKNVNYTQNVSDSLNGSQAAKLYNVQDNIAIRALKSAKSMEESLRSLKYTQAWALELIYSVAELFCFIIPCTIGAILMMHGQLEVGTLVLIIDLAMNFITPVVTIFQEFNQVKATTPMWKKTEKALQYKFENSSEKIDKFKEIKIRDVGYKTKSDNTQIFSNVTFNVEPGEKVLLMAPSGWGKTTLLKIMQGIKNPNFGSININDRNVTGNWKKAHNYYSYVNQKPFLFDDTLEFNITLGRDVSKHDLLETIEKAGLINLVKDKGLGFNVGENGNNLSGGQIQRVEIARALISKRPILLADEATSALDPELSLEIHRTLLANSQIAVIEVAHKISEEEKSMFDNIIHLEKN